MPSVRFAERASFGETAATMVTLRNVGIGANVPLVKGTRKCDGAVSPDGSVMGAIDSGRALTVLNFARPRSYQYERKYA